MISANTKIFFSGIILLLLPFLGLAQWQKGNVNVFFKLPEIALVDIEPEFDNNVYFTINPGTESGESPEFLEPTNSNLWINYTSSLADSKHTRNIVAEIAEGALPEGINLHLQASEFSGKGKGQLGNPTGRIELSAQSQPVISNIGNCYTGDNITNGHSLTYTIEIADYSKIFSVNDLNILILYTLTDN